MAGLRARLQGPRSVLAWTLAANLCGGVHENILERDILAQHPLKASSTPKKDEEAVRQVYQLAGVLGGSTSHRLLGTVTRRQALGALRQRVSLGTCH